MFRYSGIVQLFHPTTILCDTISLYLNTYFSRNFLHYHPFRQGLGRFAFVVYTHKSKRNYIRAFGAEYNFYAARLRACVFRAMRNRALPHPPRVGWRLGMEKALVCVFFAATESSSEAFDSSWSSGKPVVKVCHCNTQVTCDFLTHLVFRTSV